MFKVVDVFAITGRGTVVAVEGAERLPRKPLKARLSRPDGSLIEAVAYQERFQQRATVPHDHQAFLLAGVEASNVAIGDLIEITG